VLLSGVVVLVPVTIILILTIVQMVHLATDITSNFGVSSPDALPKTVQDVIKTVNAGLAPLSGSDTVITSQGIVDFIKTTVPGILKFIIGSLTGFIGGIPVAVVLTIMYLILLFEFLVYGKKIIGIVHKLSPFDQKVTSLYLERIGLITNAMAKGQLFISFVISLISSLMLSVFLGLGDYFVLMTIVFTLMNLVPLGCGILVIPIAVIGILTGLVWQGAVVLVLYLFVSNLDAVIRPRIIPKSITLSAGLTMLAAFGGIALFGLLGVVYGPIIMIVLVTSVEMYLAETSTKKVSA
jgi:predicted PurR-regulated permease PerM